METTNMRDVVKLKIVKTTKPVSCDGESGSFRGSSFHVLD